MRAITWESVDRMGRQWGSCDEGMLVIEPLGAEGRMRVRFTPCAGEGETEEGVIAGLKAMAATWSPERNRMAARHPLSGGSEIAEFHDRACARLHLNRMFATTMPAQSAAERLTQAGFIKATGTGERYRRKVGPHTFTVTISGSGLTLELLRTRHRPRMLANLRLPVEQDVPVRSVGLWPNEAGTIDAFAAAAVAITAGVIAGATDVRDRSIAGAS